MTVYVIKIHTNLLTFTKIRSILLNTNLKAIHNKDYSVVKTFRAARKRRSLFLQTCSPQSPAYSRWSFPPKGPRFPCSCR